MSDVKWSYLANQHAMITVGSNNIKFYRKFLNGLKCLIYFLMFSYCLGISYFFSRKILSMASQYLCTVSKIKTLVKRIFTFTNRILFISLLGAFVLILEYPRSGKRQLIGRQSIPERAYQFCLAKQFNKMGHLYSNYFPRFILYFA